MGLGALSMGSPASRPGSSAGAGAEFGPSSYFMSSAPQDVPLPASVPSTPGFVGSPGAGSPALLARDLADAAAWGDAGSPPGRGVPQRRPSILRSTVVAQ